MSFSYIVMKLSENSPTCPPYFVSAPKSGFCDCEKASQQFTTLERNFQFDALVFICFYDVYLVLLMIEMVAFVTGFLNLTITNIVSQDDGYIPKHSVLELQKAWPGSEVRWVTGGHVSSFLLHNGEFRRAIVDGLNRLPWKESS